jgi:hypothetical protein
MPRRDGSISSAENKSGFQYESSHQDLTFSHANRLMGFSALEFIN